MHLHLHLDSENQLLGVTRPSIFCGCSRIDHLTQVRKQCVALCLESPYSGRESRVRLLCALATGAIQHTESPPGSPMVVTKPSTTSCPPTPGAPRSKTSRTSCTRPVKQLCLTAVPTTHTSLRPLRSTRPAPTPNPPPLSSAPMTTLDLATRQELRWRSTVQQQGTVVQWYSALEKHGTAAAGCSWLTRDHAHTTELTTDLSPIPDTALLCALAACALTMGPRSGVAGEGTRRLCVHVRYVGSEDSAGHHVESRHRTRLDECHRRVRVLQVTQSCAGTISMAECIGWYSADGCCCILTALLSRCLKSPATEGLKSNSWTLPT